MKLKKFIPLVFAYCYISTSLFGQETPLLTEKDTTIAIKENKGPGIISILFKGKPGKAFGYSLLLPGAGQVYNHRIWKVPIVYAGLGTMGYFIYFNRKEYKRFDSAYRMRIDLEDNSTDEFQGILDIQGINIYRQYYDRNLQLSYIGFAAAYLLNGIEAFIDRHLQEFNVNDDLSIQILPKMDYASAELGIRLKF